MCILIDEQYCLYTIGSCLVSDSDEKVPIFEKVPIYYVYREPSANVEINNLIT